MRLATQSGVRLGRPPMTDLDHLIQLARMTPYNQLSIADRYRLKLALDLQHSERERVRFLVLR